MRLSEFWDAVDFEFGKAEGRVLTHDLSLIDLDDRTAEQALADGEHARTVWEALCLQMNVPRSRWFAYDRTLKA